MELLLLRWWQMWASWLLLFFVAVIAKLLLAMATIYFLLPDDEECSACGGETLRIETSGRAGDAMRGFVQRRWCLGCGSEGWARPLRPPQEPRARNRTETHLSAVPPPRPPDADGKRDAA